MVAVRHLGFVKSKVFKGRGSYETHFASAYQISQRSVKPLHGYRNFCDFQDGGRCHFGLSKIRNFNISSAVGANMCHRAKIGQTVAEIWQFTFFIKWRPSAILDLLGTYWGHLR